MIKVSIIIPIYNAEKYLVQCLESVLSQTLLEIEVICVNDGSSDSSKSIIEHYAKLDSRIRAIHKINEGYGKAVNSGIQEAQGQYIGIVEGDDYIHEEMYEKLFLQSEEYSIDVVKGNFYDCYDQEDGTILKVINDERNNMPNLERVFQLREFPQILWGHPSIWSGIYKKSFLENNNIVFQEEKGGGWVDNPFFFETLCKATSIKWLKEPLYFYRKTNMESSSIGYDLNIPFDRMMDNLAVLKDNSFNDIKILKYAYARALMYLCGAQSEDHYDQYKDQVKNKIQNMLTCMNSDIIDDYFHVYDQKTFYKNISPLYGLSKKVTKLLIYNWVPFDTREKIGGGVSIYCKNLIDTILKNRPDITVYFLSSGWAYDITRKECYINRTENEFGDKCRSYEIINSPVPAPQSMLLCNPQMGIKNNLLKGVFKDFLNAYGPFGNIHFNNLEGLSLDVLELKEDFKETKFIYSMHNYIPICTTGFYYDRFKHENCNPHHTCDDCASCINRNQIHGLKDELINRAKYNRVNYQLHTDNEWCAYFGFDQIEKKINKNTFKEFTDVAIENLNQYVDVILAVSKRVANIAVENGIDLKKINVSYIGTKVASSQIKTSCASRNTKFTIGYLGNNLDYEEKGYPFLLNALSSIDKNNAKEINVILTTTTQGKDDLIKEKLCNFNDVKIIHGYSHEELPSILGKINLGVVPVLWEDNLPQIAIEMVAHGVPILTSDFGGASELCTLDQFKFQGGNQQDFIEKILFIKNNPNEIVLFWKYHKGLVTLKDHLEELEAIYNFPYKKNIEISFEEYTRLVRENEFLYKYLNLDNYNIENELRSQCEKLEREKSYLEYSLNETRKSFTYRIGRIITFSPRLLRKVFYEKEI